MISLDSFPVAKGVKTFISINADTANKRIRLETLPDTLTAYEKTLWSKYTLLVENNFGEAYAYINSGAASYLLPQNRYASLQVVAPLTNQYAQLVVKNRFTQTFEAEGGYQYNITEGLIKQSS